MKSFTLIALVLSTSAFAATPNFSAIQAVRHAARTTGPNMGQCMNTAWNSVNPTDDQNTQANANMQAIQDAFNQAKPTLQADMQTVMKAWGAYPISNDAVNAAESAMSKDISPLMAFTQSKQIDTLNLLTADQRTDFDQSFQTCMKQQQR